MRLACRALVPAAILAALAACGDDPAAGPDAAPDGPLVNPIVCEDLSDRVVGPPPADWYVTRDGSDDADGTTYATAFATIQRAVDALEPGQTLVIGPGEYFGAVTAPPLGSAEVDTVIRAEIPGTVLLRGDVPAPGSFQPVPGTRRVHVTDWPTASEIEVLNEVDTLMTLARVPNVAELEYAPGRFHQDRATGRVYVSTTDARPADEHRYTATVVGTHGLYLDTPTRVRVEGLIATGFNHHAGRPYGEQTLWATYGIFIKNGRRSVVSDCQAYLNGRGIGSSNEYDPAGGDNLITGCRAWGNGGVGLSYDTGGIDLLYPRRDEVRDSVSFLNQANGISIRGGVADHSEADASFIRDSLAWGNLEFDSWIKAGTNFNYYERSVGTGRAGNTDHFRHCVIGSGAAEGADTIILGEEPDLDPGAEFADPDNRDYRLQARSRFLGAAPDGSDRGAFVHADDVRFLAVDGSDAADGRSVDQAFATLDHALAALPPGGTLYLSPGAYAGDHTVTLSGTAEAPIRIAGRGTEPAILTGRLRVLASRHVIFERVHFAGDVGVEGGEAIRFRNDVFLGASTALTAANTVGLEVTQSTFTGFATAAVSLPCSVGAQLAGNLYDNRGGPALQVFGRDAIRYSDYNSYARLEGAWALGEEAGTLEEVRAGHDLAAREIVPEFEATGGTVALRNPVAFQGGGPAGAPFGAFRRDVRRSELSLLGLDVHSVSATTANVEWFTSHPAVTTLSWGPTPEVGNVATLDANRFASYSLTGLTPGTTYYLRIDALATPAYPELAPSDPVVVPPVNITFTTLAQDAAPRTYYVAPSGSDSSDGLAPETPFRTIQKAADVVNVGDTVIVRGGTYPETVRIRATGTLERPISFLGQPGELVTLDGVESLLDFGFVIGKKEHLRFDSFFFSGHGAGFSESGAWKLHMGGQFNVFESRDIQISRVLSDGRTTGSRLVVAQNVDGLRLSNTVDGNKLEGHYFGNCPNLVIENSVFARPMIAAFILRNAVDEPALIHHNVFTDSLAVKSYQDTLGNPNNVSLIIIDGRTEPVRLEDNLFFLRYFGPDERHLVGSMGHAELDGVLLFGTRFGDPAFQGVADLLAAGGTLDPYDSDPLLIFPPDSLWSMDRPFNFRTWMATDPSVLDAGIGLDPTRFDPVTGLPD